MAGSFLQEWASQSAVELSKADEEQRVVRERE
jgi:hypothetical protein